MASGHGGKREGAGRPRVGVTGASRAAIKADTKDRRSTGLSAVAQVTATSGKFKDSFVNYSHNLGLGAANILSSSTSSFAPLTRIRVLLEWMYRGQFVCKNAVDVVANDMTRQGVDIKGSIKPEQMASIEQAIVNKGIWNKIRSTIKWSRLYGGCLAMLLIDGQRPDTPLRLETVGRDQFKGLLVLDRWMVEPSLELLVTDIASPSLGLPMYYRVTADAPALPRMKIHHSRIIRLAGCELPYWQSLQENLWGLSVLETIQDRIQAFDLGSTGAAQLINKSFIRTFKVEGLKELIGSNSQAYQGLLKYVELMRAFQGIEGITLMDLKDEYQGHEHGSFSGLSEIITEFRQQLSGALKIPQTKLFGTSPAGMNATGESDIRNYYDMIHGEQEAELLVPATVIYRCEAQSQGIKLPSDFGITFKPLWQPTETEKADVATKITTAVLQAEEQGIISPQTALLELKQQAGQTGVFSNITQDDIESAADAPVPPEALDMGGQEPEGGEAPPKPGKPPKKPPTKDAAGKNVMYEGMPLHIENEKGTTRKSRDPSNPWQAIMAADYGYIIGTGSAEGPREGMDIFLYENPNFDKVYVINQRDLVTGGFDEHKVMLGFPSENAAKSAYISSYSDLQGCDRIMSCVECTVPILAAWLIEGDMQKPYGD
jgi:uncharacterized protein